MNEVAIIGCFYAEGNVSDGQGVKTKILTEEIERVYGKDNVQHINTYNWKKNPLRLFMQSISAVRKCKNVMFLTDDKGTKVIPVILNLANISGKCKIHYYVVGGWLSSYLDSSRFAVKTLKKLDAIYVELPAMFRELKERGFNNGVLVNKFRRLTPVKIDEVELYPKAPYKLCFFSRVMREKGIEEAVEMVKTANERVGFEKYTLDIYGAINTDYRERFEEMIKAFPPYISYKGVVDYKKSGEVLKNYFAMIFPTYYKSEGYANAIVDAFAAGLPVVATDWNYNADVVRDRVDGILVETGNVEQLFEAVEEMTENPEKYADMRLKCIERCTEYLPENAIAKVIEQFE